jgi:hypothetical protein
MKGAAMTALGAVLVSAGVLLSAGAGDVSLGGRVVDASSGQPIANAIVTDGPREARTDLDGWFRLANARAETVGVRAYGYLRTDVPARTLASGPGDIPLTPFRPKALYLSFYGIGSRQLRTAALDLIDTTELNALVIDVKGDRGMVAFRSAVPLAAASGAQKIITIPDLQGLVDSLRERGIYTIARIVVFKDPLLAAARPDLAVHRRDGALYLDREKLAWVSPYSEAVWDYNIALAQEAAQAGFDEIQFDYTRLPDDTGLAFPEPWNQASREAAITGFLRRARTRLTPFNVFLAVDVFGYICWNLDDTRIGQRLEPLATVVDYVSPMLYPSGFQFGIPGYRNPVQHPYEIVHLSLERATQRSGLPAVRFRPWLQAFRDYAFGGQAFDADEIAAQIKGADDFGSHGWMLWNPQNRYSAEGIAPTMTDATPPSATPTRRGRVARSGGGGNLPASGTNAQEQRAANVRTP